MIEEVKRERRVAKGQGQGEKGPRSPSAEDGQADGGQTDNPGDIPREEPGREQQNNAHDGQHPGRHSSHSGIMPDPACPYQQTEDDRQVVDDIPDAALTQKE